MWGWQRFEGSLRILYIYTYTYTHLCMYIHIHMYIYLYIHMHGLQRLVGSQRDEIFENLLIVAIHYFLTTSDVFTHARTHTQTRTHTHTYTRTHTTHTHTHAHIPHKHTHTHTHTHTYRDTRAVRSGCVGRRDRGGWWRRATNGWSLQRLGVCPLSKFARN